MTELTARELLDVIRPHHDRTSCSDEKRANSFFSRGYGSWQGRCTRCMWLDLADGEMPPDGFVPEDAFG